jgi:hypothetical protein
VSIKRINQFPDGNNNLTGDDILLFMDSPSGSGVTKTASLSELSEFITSSGVGISLISGTGILIQNNPNNYTINSLALISNPSGIPGATAVTNIVQISQNDYNNLSTVDPNTLYIIN